MGSITYSGYLCLLLILLIVIKARKNLWTLPTMPLFIICATSYNFFGSFKYASISLRTELILALSFILLIASYSVAKKIKINLLINFFENLVDRKYTDGILLVKDKIIYLYIIIVIVYCIFDLWLNTQLYGSLEAAIIRFYSGIPDESFPTIYKNIQGFAFTVVVAFIFVFRFFFNIYNKNPKILYFPIALLILISIPRGSRGATITPLLFLIAADIFAATFHNISFKKKIREYLVIVFAAGTLVLTLTVIRDINFKDITEVYDQLNNLSLIESKEQLDSGERDLMINDAQFCFDNFGHRLPYLSLFSSLKSITVSPIPRKFIPNKPVTFGYILNEAKLGGSNFSVQKTIDSKVGWAAGVAGEGWANYGYIGVCFYSIIFGIYSGICSKLYYHLIYSNNYLSIVFSILFWQASSNFIRGDLQSCTVQVIFPIIILIIGIKIFYPSNSK